MRILHLLSQTHLTGPEVYVAALCRKLSAEGHECFVVSDTLTVDVDAAYFAMSIDNRSVFNRIRNIIQLVLFCRRKRIDLIHAHSRASSWIANFVSKITRIAYVSTIHGRQSQYAAKRKINIYGHHIIVVCDHLQTHVRNELNIKDAEVRMIRNGFD